VIGSGDDNWSLAMVTDDASDEALRSVLRALLSHPALDGPYPTSALGTKGDGIIAIEHVILGATSQGAWCGGDLTGGVRVPLLVTTFLHGRGTGPGEELGEHIDLEAPMHDLRAVWPDIWDAPESDDRFRQLDDWFVDFARAAAKSAHFRQGIIGRQANVDSRQLCGRSDGDLQTLATNHIVVSGVAGGINVRPRMQGD
jgi:hypothetical protein